MNNYIIGEIISTEESISQNALGKGGYFIYLTKDLVLDCFKNKDGVCMASMANTAANTYNENFPMSPVKNNASIITTKENGIWVAYLRVRENYIEADEEILVPYSITFRNLK